MKFLFLGNLSFLKEIIKDMKKKAVIMSDKGFPDKNENEVFCGFTVSTHITADRATTGFLKPKAIKSTIIRVKNRSVIMFFTLYLYRKNISNM